MAGNFNTSQATSAPWDVQVPYLKEAFSGGQQLYKQGVPEYYQGPTVAGFDPLQTQAQEGIYNYAYGPRTAALQSAAEAANLGQMYGDTPFTGEQRSDLLAGNVPLGSGTPFNLMGNALQQQVQNQLTGNILPGIRQSLVEYQPGGSSRGNMLQQQAIADAVTQGMTMPLAEMYSGAYDRAQTQRLPMAPVSMQQAVGDVGAQRRAMSQEAINQAMMRYNYEAQRPQIGLQNYLSNISGAYGGRSTATPSPLSGMGQLAGLVSGLGII
jgi:hypothetical protein